ncbi:MAG: fused MFS/spermidine synthase [Bacteroidales bacterium]|nr:fused MFS/spermidine synthase [Bacteroidales bacterium]
MQLTRNKYRVFTLLFFLSGFAGLIYESVWTQYLKALLGHAAFAQTFILIVFLAGLAAGSWLGGNLIMRYSRLFRLYGFAELGIGVLALAFHPIFIWIKSFVIENSAHVLAEPFGYVFIFLLTFPATLMLGSTFPLLAGAFQDGFPEKKERAVSYLYFINSAGAALGVLASGFLLIPKFGLPYTILTAGIINLFIGLVSLHFSKTFAELKHTQHSESIADLPRKRFSMNAVLTVALLTGASSMMYEVGWIRLLSMVLGSSVQAFELMISAFIFGLALGALWMYGRIAGLKSPHIFLIRVQLLMGMLAIFSLVIYNQSYNLMEFLLNRIPRDGGGYWLFNLGSNGIAFLVMLPAAICAGMTLPLMIAVLQKEGESRRVIGNVYALNTMGGIISVLLAFHFLMPVFGLKYLMIGAGGLDVFAGIGLIIFYRRHRAIQVFSLAAAAVILLAIAVVWFRPDPIKMASGVFRYGKIDADKKILFHKDGKTASVAMAESIGGNLVLTTNGKPDASINIVGRTSGDEATQVLLAALPLSIINNPEQVAVIGLGSGKTAHTVLMNQRILSVDVIEIEPAIAEAVQYFKPWVENIFYDQRFSLYIDDARNYLSASVKKYDLIISEPSNPWIVGMSGLFTGQFYEMVESALTDRGVFVQWMHIYEMNMQLFVSVVKAFSPHFDDYQIYFLDDGDVVLLGRKSGNPGFPGSDIFTNTSIKSELLKLGIESKNDLMLRYFGSKQTLDPFFFSYGEPANNDFYPTLEYGAPRARFLNESIREFDELLTSPVPVLKSFSAQPTIFAEHLGPDYAFLLSEQYRNADKIFTIFREVEQGNFVTYGALGIDLALLVRNVLSINTNHFDKSGVEGWLKYLRSFTEKTMPFLDPGQMEIIWDVLESASGFQYLGAYQKLEVRLYRAIGEDDYQSILKLTKQFRNDLPPIGSKFEEIQLTALSWALIKAGEVGEVKLILESYPNLSDQSAVLRFLKSIAEAPMGF